MARKLSTLTKKKKTKTKKKGAPKDAVTEAHSAFLQSKERLDEYINKPNVRPVVESLRILISEYNASLDRMKHEFREEVRGKGPKKRTVGDFKASRIVSRVFDIDTLTEAISLMELEEFGAVKTMVKYKFDEAKLLDLVAAQQLPEEVYREAAADVEKTPRVSSPHKEKIL